MEKAFDKVPHKQLLRKIKSYNINEQIFGWIESFLSTRRQRVHVLDSFSNWALVLSGLPQGSILGPLLFLIYINDLVDCCSSESEVALYADDTKLYKYIRCEDDFINLQTDLNNILDWIKKWSLSLNVDKCKVVSFGKKIQVNSQYIIGDTLLEKVEEIKDLGVVFDSKLKFNIHINDKINKAFSVLGVIKRNFKYMDSNTFIMLYKSMVRPHLEYANLVWYPYKKEDIKNIERVQRRATKLIVSLKNLTYQERLKKLKLPTLKYRRLRGDMIEVYKIVSGKFGDDNFVNLETINENNTRGNGYKLFKRHSRYDIRKYFFTNRVVSVWNSLPDNVVMVKNTNIFKTSLDNFWSNQDVLYNWESELTGTGSRSIYFDYCV